MLGEGRRSGGTRRGESGQDGNEAAGAGTPLPAAAVTQNIERWREAAEKLRGRVDLTAKAVGGIGTTAATAIGISKIGDLFPLTPGARSWLAFFVAIAGFVALSLAIAIVTYRLWSVNQPIFMRTDPDAMKDQGDVDERERDAIRVVYEETADLNRAESLRSYEARAHRLRRVAERTRDDDERARVDAKADQIAADIQATFARAALRVIRRRTTNAVRGAGSVFAYLLFVAGLLSFAVGTDYIASERTDQVTIAKSCEDARNVGADSATLPAICGADARAEQPEPTSAAQQRANAAAALNEPLRRCLALVAAGRLPSGSCDPIAGAARALLARR